MAPTAMIAPWPTIRRGMEAMVPTVPGLVSEMVVPWKSGVRELAGTRAADEVVEGGGVAGEVERAGVLDVGDHEAASAALGRNVDGDAEVDLLAEDAARLAVVLGEGVVERRVGLHGFDDGPADDVGVGDLALAERVRDGG